MVDMRRLGANAVALVFGCLLAAGAAELAVTLGLGEQVKFPRHVVAAPWGLRFNEPGAVYRHKSADVEVWFRIDHQGMRDDRDFAYAKPPGVKRIVSLGDSFTIGYEVALEDTFSQVLERELGRRGRRVEVLNAGVSGFGTAEEAVYLERELWKYAPDLVLVSFFVNDYADSVRSDLFRLDEHGALVTAAQRYVPGGRLGDLLNENPLLAWLSGYSNAFALVKERATGLAKRELMERNLAHAESATHEASAESATHEASAAPAEAIAYDRRLVVAVFERLYADARAHGVPLVIQSIPYRQYDPLSLVETFPDELDTARAGLFLLRTKPLLDPYLGQQLLYWDRSHSHWTPFSHARSGEALAELIDRHGLLE
jgi:hypothetical protein